jgi:hypothetical protein
VKTSKSLRTENERLSADLEQARVQLAGCGIIAMCNTENSLRGQMPAPGVYGYSVSLAEVERAVRREIALRAAAREALAVLTRLADSAAYWSEYDVPVEEPPYCGEPLCSDWPKEWDAPCDTVTGAFVDGPYTGKVLMWQRLPGLPPGAALDAAKGPK